MEMSKERKKTMALTKVRKAGGELSHRVARSMGRTAVEGRRLEMRGRKKGIRAMIQGPEEKPEVRRAEEMKAMLKEEREEKKEDEEEEGRKTMIEIGRRRAAGKKRR